VNHLSQRLQEVSRLGFKQCVIPRYGSDKVEIPEGLEVFRVRNIREAIEFAL
jgi:DNA repair protein RadA/Sms